MAWDEAEFQAEIAGMFEDAEGADDAPPAFSGAPTWAPRTAHAPASLWAPPPNPWPWRSRMPGDKREEARAAARAEREAEAARAELRTAAIEARAAGLPFPQIAARLGVSLSYAYRLVNCPAPARAGLLGPRARRPAGSRQVGSLLPT